MATSQKIPMYYINLDRRIPRKKQFEKQTNDMKVERFSAYDGMKDKESRNKNIKRGEFGCWVSHTELWKKIAYSNKTSIIFEDDINFSSNFQNKLNDILTEGKDLEYDILLLSHNWHTKKVSITNNISTIGLFYGLQGYMITPKCAKYLINKYPNIEKVSKPLDVVLGENNIENKIKILSVREKLVTLNSFSKGSDTNRV